MYSVAPPVSPVAVLAELADITHVVDNVQDLAEIIEVFVYWRTCSDALANLVDERACCVHSSFRCQYVVIPCDGLELDASLPGQSSALENWFELETEVLGQVGMKFREGRQQGLADVDELVGVVWDNTVVQDLWRGMTTKKKMLIVFAIAYVIGPTLAVRRGSPLLARQKETTRRTTMTMWRLQASVVPAGDPAELGPCPGLRPCLREPRTSWFLFQYFFSAPGWLG